MKERTVAPWNQHIVYLCYRFGYHINPPSNRCSSRDFLCCLLSRYFLNGCRFDFLSLSPDLTSCPDRSPLFFLFQVVVTRGGMRRSASPRDAPHRIRSFLPLRLGFSSTWPTATRANAGFNLEHYHQLTYECEASSSVLVNFKIRSRGGGGSGVRTSPPRYWPVTRLGNFGQDPEKVTVLTPPPRGPSTPTF